MSSPISFPIEYIEESTGKETQNIEAVTSISRESINGILLPFSDGEERLMESVTNAAYHDMRTGFLFEYAAKKFLQNQVATEMAISLSFSVPMEESLQPVLDSARVLLNCERIVCYSSDKTQTLTSIVASPAPASNSKASGYKMQILDSKAIAAHTLKTCLISNVKNTLEDDRFSKPVSTSLRIGMGSPHDQEARTLCCCPLIGDENSRPFGIIEAQDKRADDPDHAYFTADDLQILKYVGGLTVLYLQQESKKATLQELSTELQHKIDSLATIDQDVESAKKHQNELKRTLSAANKRASAKRRSSEVLARASSRRLLSMSTFQKNAKAIAKEKTKVVHKKNLSMKELMSKLAKEEEQRRRRLDEERRLSSINTEWSTPMRLAPGREREGSIWSAADLKQLHRETSIVGTEPMSPTRPVEKKEVEFDAKTKKMLEDDDDFIDDNGTLSYRHALLHIVYLLTTLMYLSFLDKFVIQVDENLCI
eukprot:g734.t1